MVGLAGDSGKAGSVEKVREQLASSGGGTWIRTVPKDDELTVRFLTEPEEWFFYREHFRQDVKFFPCVDRNCPGCNDSDDQITRRSRRFLANALDVEQGVVVPLKLPLDLANRLFSRYERYGTLTDRDYILMRAGQGLNTTYDLDTMEPKEVDISRYELIDCKALLVQQYEDAFGTSMEGGPEVDNDDGKEKSDAADPHKKSDNIPSESSRSSEEDDGGDTISEDEMLELTHNELYDLAQKLGIQVNKGEEATRQEIVNDIFAQAQAS